MFLNSLILHCLAVLSILQAAYAGAITGFLKDKLSSYIPEIKIFKEGERCYEPYGCFSNSEFEGALPDFLSAVPESPDQLNITYFLFTGKNPIEPFSVAYNQSAVVLKESHFDPTYPIKFIIHGYRSRYRKDGWNGLFRRMILKSEPEANVFVVSIANGFSATYPVAVVTTKVVAAIIADFIKQLKESYDVSNKHIHIIGHSLGAHTAGLVGKVLKENGQKIARITGLDPAGPYYDHDIRDLRLDETDADFVEVIHTADSSLIKLGIRARIGHVDFYPNGGSQPKCSTANKEDQARQNSGVFGGMIAKIQCHHKRAAKLLLASAEAPEDCINLAYECSSWESFSNGSCTDCGERNENCMVLKYYRNPPVISQSGKSYYLKTGGSPPYCGHQYLVTVKVGDEQAPVNGWLKVNLRGEFGEIPDVIFSENFRANAEYRTVVFSEKFIGALLSAEVYWLLNRRQTIVNWMPMTKSVKEIDIVRISLKAMSILDPVRRRSENYDLCPGDENLSSGEQEKFVPCNINKSDGWIMIPSN